MRKAEVIDNLEELTSLRGEWADLVSKLPSTTPFQTPEWMLTWWRHFGNGDLSTFVFRDSGGELVGIIPAFRHTWQGKRQITLLGSGISDYLDPPVIASYQDAVVCELKRHLLANTDWDVCNWQDLSVQSCFVGLSIDTRLAVREEAETPCSEIVIEQSFDEFLAGRSRGLRRNLRRYRQKAEQAAPLQIEVRSEHCSECLEALIRLHGMRWREQGEWGTIAANRSAAFLRDVANEFAARRMLQFAVLRYQGQIAAVILAFPYRDVTYAYISGFDPAYAAFGFGALALCEALRHAFEEGRTAWNFLRGEESYKFDWGARVIPKSRLLITRASIE